MLHKSFFEILEGIYARGMYVEELNTNGYFIDRQALDRMKAIGCIPLMKISFDGLGYHDWMRAHQGAEETALRAIRLCVENGFPVKVQTNMNRPQPRFHAENGGAAGRYGRGGNAHHPHNGGPPLGAERGRRLPHI